MRNNNKTSAQSTARTKIIRYFKEVADDKGSVFTSYKEIARACGIAKTTAITNVSKLVEEGVLSKEKRKAQCQRVDIKNGYTVNQ